MVELTVVHLMDCRGGESSMDESWRLSRDEALRQRDALAQQLEQAEQKLNLSTATSATLWKRAERYREALERFAEHLHFIGGNLVNGLDQKDVGTHAPECPGCIARAALTSQDSEQ